MFVLQVGGPFAPRGVRINSAGKLQVHLTKPNIVEKFPAGHLNPGDPTGLLLLPPKSLINIKEAQKRKWTLCGTIRLKPFKLN